MKRFARQPILSAATCWALLGAGSSTPSLMARQSTDTSAPVARSAAPVKGDEGERWLKETLATLDDPTEVRMPFADDLVELGSGHVAVAYAFHGLGGQSLEVHRLLPADGAPDPAFAESAYATNGPVVRDVNVAPDGKVVVSGREAFGDLLIRLNADGGFDTGFGLGDGVVQGRAGDGSEALLGEYGDVQPDGRIVLLDFGLAKDFPPGFREGVLRLAAAILSNDARATAEAFRALGFRTRRDDDASLVWLGEAFLGWAIKNGRAYADPQMVQQLGEEMPKIMRANPVVQVPPDVLLVGRVLGLLSGINKQLGAEVDIGATLMPYLLRSGLSPASPGA